MILSQGEYCHHRILGASCSWQVHRAISGERWGFLLEEGCVWTELSSGVSQKCWKGPIKAEMTLRKILYSAWWWGEKGKSLVSQGFYSMQHTLESALFLVAALLLTVVGLAVGFPSTFCLQGQTSQLSSMFTCRGPNWNASPNQSEHQGV